MLNVLVCSFEAGIHNIARNLPEKKEDVQYFISWQGLQTDLGQIPSALKGREDVFVGALPGKGLSKNRNNCIKLAKSHQATGYFLLSDDDVEFLPDFESKIMAAFTSYPNTAILCFQVQSRDPDQPFKNYWMETKTLGIKDVDKVSSIEIAGKVELLDYITFDERLGLGASFPSGEEVAFLADAYRAGFQIQFIPEYITIHPHETSGKYRKSQFTREALSLIGGRAYRIYGERLAKFFFLFSAIKNYPNYKNNLTFYTYLKTLNDGLKTFKETENA